MYRSRVVWASPVGGPYLSTHFADNAFTPTVTHQQFVDAIGAFWGVIDGSIDSNVTWSVEGSVDEIDAATGNLIASVAVTPPSGVGGLPGDMGPAASQGLVRWITSGIVGGRRVRGRTFIPGLSEGISTEGRLGPATIATFLGAANTLRTDVPLVVWHRPTPPAADGSAHRVESAAVWNEFAMLTSRRD